MDALLQHIDLFSACMGLVFGGLVVAILLLILDALSMRSIKKTLNRFERMQGDRK